ncbi:MAG: transcription termination factor NusA [Saccharofermentanales bacterium]|jgi:N utilization substance protein A|nr:transcription termination factor NusA [Bacillota bacterium]
MNPELIEALKLLEKERGLDLEILFQSIEEALVSAYKREFDIRADRRDSSEEIEADDISAEVDRKTGEMRVYQTMTVVEEVTDPHSQLSLEDAKALSDELDLGDQLVREVDPADFGRLAAQTAKSVINQRLAQAEKERIHNEFSGRVGELSAGVVQRKDRREVTVDIGRAEAVLPNNEQSRLDGYTFNQRMKFYIMKVDERRNRPVIIVSRSHPNLVRRLFEQEVPEISSGVVEIVNIAREAGSRTKMAVASSDPNVDSVGACVGQRGLRVQSIIDELNGEKIDIIEWDADPVVYISHALSPAKVIRVEVNEEEQSATVVVPDHQLSLAIGREGQNARLAARLTGWKIDIKNEAQYREMLENELFSRFDQALAEEETEAGWTEDEGFDSEMEGADDWAEDEEFDFEAGDTADWTADEEFGSEADAAADLDSTETTETEEAGLTDDADSDLPAGTE